MAAGTIVRPFNGWMIQLLFTIVGLGIAVAAAAVSSPGNASSLAVLVFVPVSAAIGMVNWVAAAFVGLPLRLVRPLWRWWNAHPYVTLIGIAVGALAFALSLVFATPGVEIDPEIGYEYDVRTPVWWLFWTGWALIAFFLAHFPMDGRWRSAPAEASGGH
jgi:hypothetical protein